MARRVRTQTIIEIQTKADSILVFIHRWSYLLNYTLIGNAVYMSMDIPDTFLAVRPSAHTHPICELRYICSSPNFSTTCNGTPPKFTRLAYSLLSGRKSS